MVANPEQTVPGYSRVKIWRIQMWSRGGGGRHGEGRVTEERGIFRGTGHTCNYKPRQIKITGGAAPIPKRARPMGGREKGLSGGEWG